MHESDVEEAAVDVLRELGYPYVHGPALSSDATPYGSHGMPERASHADVVLEGRLRAALQRINPHLDADTLDRVLKTVARPASPSVEENNVAFQRWLTKGVPVEVRKADAAGQVATRGDLAWLVDFENPDNNDWLVVGQLTLKSGRIKQQSTRRMEHRRPDLVVFVNGMPMAVIELKNPADTKATIKTAWHQLQTYKREFPTLFATNELMVISDGTAAQVGSLTAGYERFAPWRTTDGDDLAEPNTPQMSTLLRGLFDKRRFLDFIHHFVVWETDGGRDIKGSWIKKIAGYHQFHAVNKAIAHTVRASLAVKNESPDDATSKKRGKANKPPPRKDGDKRIGVVWHTQGAGKSIAMAIYAAKLVREPALENPTLVVLTDRNDLDGQLFDQFCAASGILPTPVQADSRQDLQDKLKVASGGIVFTTIQKFGTTDKGGRYPELSARRNIVVIADEAHRSQYAFIEGFAVNLRRALPNASFIGFTGTPIEFSDKSTVSVFGEYIHTYPVRQAVEDGAILPLHYEARMARIQLPEDKKPKVDEDFAEVTEGEEEAAKGKLKSKWARLEAMVGTDQRLELIAGDLLAHFDRRCENVPGKAMVVCMSRRIAVKLYEKIVELRPEWASDDDEGGGIKVVMTGTASDPENFHPHIRKKPGLKRIENRFKDPADSLRIVIVRDMWLTGFNAPCAHTLYVDKPMKGHGFMQAIARVNRVFKDKPSGLVVDYLGLAEPLREATHRYGGGDGTGDEETLENVAPPLADVAVPVLEEKFQIVKDLFHGHDYSAYFGKNAEARVATLPAGANHICGLSTPPLDERELKRLVTIFSDWRHTRAANYQPLEKPSADAMENRIKRCMAFLSLNLGTGDDALYDKSVDALRSLLQDPALTGVALTAKNEQLALQLEPFARKLLVKVAPKAADKLGAGRVGLGALMVHLRKAGASPYTLDLPEPAFIARDGGDQWSPLEHAVRDVIEARLDAAHRSTTTAPGLWRSVVHIMLEFIRHNDAALGPLPQVPVGTREGRKRFIDAMTHLNVAVGVAGHFEEADWMRDEIGYFRGVQATVLKYTVGGSGKTREELDAQIAQIVSQAVTSDRVIDIFGRAGIAKPDISILSDEFLATVKANPLQNLQVEMLRKLLADEIKLMGDRNAVQSRKFSEMLERTMKAYQNRSLEAAAVIAELIKHAQALRDMPQRGKELALSDDEMAFYDALIDHGGVKEVMDDKVLAAIAHDLVTAIRASVTLDWTEKEAVKADMRNKVRKLLKKHGYPPDKSKDAVLTVLEQAETVCRDWAQGS